MFMIHQIFLFVHDWFKCITWPNSSPLKLEDNWGYHPSDIPQLSNLMSTMIILYLKYNSRWESILWLLQKGGIFVCSLSCTGKNKNQKKTFHATNIKLFINIFLPIVKYLEKHKSLYLVQNYACIFALPPSSHFSSGFILNKLFTSWNR